MSNQTVGGASWGAFDGALSRRIVAGLGRAREIWTDDIEPVDVIQFVEDPEFIGGAIRLDPAPKQILWDLEDPEVREVDIEVGKGSGKTVMAVCFLLYGVYLETRRKNPQQFYGIDQWSEIAFINVSINEDQAKDVVFERLKMAVRSSPYFRRLKPKIKELSIEFPGRLALHCGHSGANAKLGYATLRGFIDEANFMRGDSSHSNAQDLFHMLVDSMVTRFGQHYKLVQGSSKGDDGSFLHQRMLETQKNGAPYVARVRRMQVIEVRGQADRQLLRVVVAERCSDAELKRTIAIDRGAEVLSMGDWRLIEGAWEREIEVRGARIEGI